MALDTLDEDDTPGTPIDVLEGWFAAHGWTHERIGDEEIIAASQGSWGQYELRGVWREDDAVLQFLAFPGVQVTEAQHSAIYETLGLINEQLWLGHFELWAGNSTLLFRHAVLLESEEAGFSIDQAETLVEVAMDELDRFYPVFQFVLWGGKSPRDAISAAMVETRGEA